MSKNARRQRRPRRTPSRHTPALEPVVQRVLDTLTDDPVLRSAMGEGLAALHGPEALKVLARLGPSERGLLYLAMRDAVSSLATGRTCDLCPQPARRVRFVAVMPGQDFRGVRRPDNRHAVTGFALVCDACNVLRPGEFARRTLDRFADVQTAVGSEPYRKEAVFGCLVGTVAHLPPQSRLEQCMDCRKALWVDPRAINGPAEDAIFLCGSCAKVRAADGRLEFLPVFPF